MNPLVRNVLAVILGLVAGSVVNMLVVMGSGSIVPPPAGADMTTAEGVRDAMPRMTPIHFFMPFLAHALGTLAGAFVAAVTAASHKMKFALAIGVVFLAGGIVAVSMIGGPLWFMVCDLVLAYLPMAWLGGRMGIAVTGQSREPVRA